jgi:glutamyl-tRNA synthetase
MQTRTHLYSYARDWGYFFVEEPAFDARAAEKHIVKAGSCPALALVRRNLEPAGFAVPEIEQAIRAAEREAGIPEGKLNQAVRVAVTGTAIGAGLYETLELIGKPRTMARLARAVERLGGAAASA